MRTLFVILWCSLFGLFTLFPAVAADPQAHPADDWTALLDRRSGWTGADGIFTTNLDGTIVSGIENRPDQRTAFVFSDTLIGNVDPTTLKRSNTKMPNHSFALLSGNKPDADKIVFFYPGDDRTPKLPIKPPENGEWYWLSECFVIDDSLHCFLLRMTKLGDGAFGFKHLGVDRVRIAVTKSGIDFKTATVFRDDPYAPRLAVFDHDLTIAMGIGVLENTEAAKAPAPDGYLYIYGYREGPKKHHDRQLVAMRCRPDELDRPQAWRYYAGEGQWSDSMKKAVGIVGQVSTELSVTPIESGPAQGKYALIYTPGTIGSKIALRLGDTPVGPFGREMIIFEERETKRLGGATFAYNAKAHPVLSCSGELLISYNINSMDGEMRIFKEGGIYHPRFVRLKLDDIPEK